MGYDRKKAVLKREAGFTLIEILLAIAILAFGLLAIASMQVMSIQTNGKANRITEGATVAMNKIEELMCSGYSGISNGTDTTDPLYDIAWTVNEDTQNGVYKTKSLTIQVTPNYSFYKGRITLNGVAVDNL